MVNVKEAIMGKYLKAEHIQESDNKMAVIVGEGQYVDGDYGRKLEIEINFNKIKMVWSANSASCQSLAEAWGEDSSDWIGKKIKFEVKTEKAKTRILAFPVDEASPKITAEKVN
jgi:hypothetical protein